MVDPTLNLSDKQEKKIQTTANDNTGENSGRKVKVNKSGQTNLGKTQPKETINLEFDIPSEERDKGIDNNIVENLDDLNDFEPPIVANDNAITPESQISDDLNNATNVSNNDSAYEPPKLKTDQPQSELNNSPANEQVNDKTSDTPDIDNSTSNNKPSAEDSANETQTNKPQQTTPNSESIPPPTDTPSPDQNNATNSENNGDEGEGEGEKENESKDRDEGEDEGEKENEDSDEKGDEKPDDEISTAEKDEAEKDDNEPSQSKPEEENEETPNTEEDANNLDDKTPPEVQPEQTKDNSKFEPGNGPVAEPPSADNSQTDQQDSSAKQNKDIQGNKIESDEPSDEKTGLGNRIKQGAKNKVNQAVENVTPEVIKRHKLKKKKRKILKELAEANKSFKGIANSKSFAIISFFMPDIGASITSTMRQVNGIKDELNEKVLKAKITPLKTIISTLETIRVGASIIDALKMWGTIFINLWWTLIVPLFLILTLPAFIIFYYLFNGMLSKSVLEIKKDFEKKLKPLEEKLKNIKKSKKLRDQLKEIDLEIKYSKQKQINQ